MPKNIVTLGGVAIPSLALVSRSQKRAWRFEEQRTVSNDTGMQSTGKEPATEEWELSLHAAFCDPEGLKAELEKKADAAQKEPLAMIWADGTMTGMFVVESISTKYEQKDTTGEVIHSRLTLSLKQADKKSPAPTPLQKTASGAKQVFGISLPTISLPSTGIPFLDQVFGQAANAAVNAAATTVANTAQEQFQKFVGNEVANRLPTVFQQMNTLQGALRTPGIIP